MRSALILGGALALAVSALNASGPPVMPLHERMAVLASSGCTADIVCDLRAADLGLDPVLLGMPDDALYAACLKGAEPACLYLEAQHRAQCADDMDHDDCAVFRDEPSH
ncbi:hypothetical protein [Ancylobacter amanitiformis]|uniref:DUF3551 domain-containing protein n=1 Tax=Ancylobacter amanitiformis TaxID=217069 RepID=A0ABU0LQE6_9HYPH|nr:hypothetical protein [Ancylobacter amanitiformis]MDQ0510901.1 hypothetical protein [Ancylobacter amanitiformis]